MKSEMLSTRIDNETKLAFSQVCKEVGLSPSQAIKLFAKAVINNGGIPFDIKVKQPNGRTSQAIQELESGASNKAENVNELFTQLGDGKLDNVNS